MSFIYWSHCIIFKSLDSSSPLLDSFKNLSKQIYNLKSPKCTDQDFLKPCMKVWTVYSVNVYSFLWELLTVKPYTFPGQNKRVEKQILQSLIKNTLPDTFVHYTSCSQLSFPCAKFRISNYWAFSKLAECAKERKPPLLRCESENCITLQRTELQQAEPTFWDPRHQAKLLTSTLG